ncbi:hypothetical protein BC830DRAFT_1164502 [Chytriomyces sp. MP71]|nr:hypothetical protein BC830DRAFT_1164502 [Chytriomyces sp. MP71]
MCSKISSIANSYNSLPAKPPKSPWRFAIRKATVVLNVESSTETEFITKFEMMKEAESVMVQEPADVSGTEFKVRTYIIQLAEFMRELPKPYATSLCFTRTFPDEHEFMGSVKDIKSGKVSASLQIHPHPSEDVLTGTLYLVTSSLKGFVGTLMRC